jgi:hypothetical protein
MEATQFPQYRKSANGRNYYKIAALDTLEEIQVMGSRWSKHSLQARILPERNLIADLLDVEAGHTLAISQHEYEAFLAKCISEFKQM